MTNTPHPRAKDEAGPLEAAPPENRKRVAVGTTVGEHNRADAPRSAGCRTLGDARSVNQPRKGDLLGRYVLVDELGAGGMGTVFSAYDPELQRNIALKLLNPAEGETPGPRHTLLVEGRALAHLHHPGIVPVYDVGDSEYGTFIAMKLVEGVTLRAWIDDRPRSRSAILEACIGAGRALAHAHKNAVVHGDFKPSNVMVEPTGHVCVVDFGLARRAETGALSPGTVGPVAGGTPAYMAPEQHLGAAPSEVSDQFSFCVTLYELLCAQRPFAGKTPTAIALSVLEDTPSPPKEQNIPRWLWRIIARGLSRQPEQRFSSMSTLVAKLRRSPARRRAAGLAVGVVGVAAALGFSMLEDPCAIETSPIHGIWGKAEAQRLDARFQGVQSWPAVRSRLDGFEKAWTLRWTSACLGREDGSVSALLFERRAACLTEHLADFRGLAASLETGGAEAVEGVDLSMVLDSGVSCDDPRALLERAPRPAEPAGSEYDAVIAGTTEIFTQAHAGAPTDTLWAGLNAFEERASELGHPRPQRYVERVRAKLLSIDGRYEDSAEALSQAFRLAEVAEDDITAMRMARRLSFLHAGFLANPRGALAWLDIAKAKRERIPAVTAEDDMILLREEARVDRKLGRLDQAITRLDQALAFGSEHALYLGDLLHDRGIAFHIDGREAEASEAFAAAASARAQTMGPEHVLVGQSRFHLARALHELGEQDAAELELGRAIEVFSIHPGAVSERLVAQSSLAIFAATRGETQLAVTRQQAVIEEVKKALGDDSSRLPAMYSNLARMLMMEDRLREALSAVNGALERGGPDAQTASYATTWSLKAEIELKLGRPEASLKSLDQALLILRDEADRTLLEVTRAWIQAHIDCDLDNARTTAAAILEASAAGTISKEALAEAQASADAWTQDGLPKACEDGANPAEPAQR